MIRTKYNYDSGNNLPKKYDTLLDLALTLRLRTLAADHPYRYLTVTYPGNFLPLGSAINRVPSSSISTRKWYLQTLGPSRNLNDVAVTCSSVRKSCPTSTTFIPF